MSAAPSASRRLARAPPRRAAALPASTASSWPRWSRSPGCRSWCSRRCSSKGRPLSGADGLLAADQLQYFAWIREAVRARPDRQPLRPRARRPRLPAPGLRPLRRAARARALRAARPTSCGSRSPSAITFAGCLLYVRRLLPAGGRRQVALVLALFAVMPASWLVAWTRLGRQPAPVHVRLHLGRDVVGAVPVGLPVDRHRGLPDAAGAAGLRALARGGRRRCSRRRAGALLVCWLQPWQGATLALIVARGRGLALAPRGASARRSRRSRSRRRPRCPRSTTPCSRPLRPRLGAGRRVQRGGRDAGVDVAVVGDRAAPSRRSPCRPRSPTGCPRRAGRSRRSGCGRSRRWRSTCCRSGRSPTTPPGPRPAALDPRRPGRA